jgi:hypothetical protein
MPGKEKNIQQALDGLDNQIADIVSNFVRLRKKHYEKVTRQLHDNLKKDAKRYTEMLADEKISKADFELLLKGRWAQLKIELLSEASVSKGKFEDIAGDLLKLTTKTLLDAV